MSQRQLSDNVRAGLDLRDWAVQTSHPSCSSNLLGAWSHGSIHIHACHQESGFSASQWAGGWDFQLPSKHKADLP